MTADWHRVWASRFFETLDLDGQDFLATLGQIILVFGDKGVRCKGPFKIKALGWMGKINRVMGGLAWWHGSGIGCLAAPFCVEGSDIDVSQEHSG